MIGVIFAPESPWWLVHKDKLDEARKSLARLCHVHKISAEFNYELEDTIAYMAVTNTHEQIIHSGVSYWDCFEGVDLRPTEVMCCVWIIQVFAGSGSAAMSYISFNRLASRQPSLSILD